MIEYKYKQDLLGKWMETILNHTIIVNTRHLELEDGEKRQERA